MLNTEYLCSYNKLLEMENFIERFCLLGVLRIISVWVLCSIWHRTVLCDCVSVVCASQLPSDASFAAVVVVVVGCYFRKQYDSHQTWMPEQFSRTIY